MDMTSRVTCTCPYTYSNSPSSSDEPEIDDGRGPPPPCINVGRDGPSMTASKAQNPEETRNEDITPFTNERPLPFASPWVKGLDLRTREWAMLMVDKLAEIRWNDDTFDRLVLPDNEMELAWQFVESKELAEDTFDDYVPAKSAALPSSCSAPPGVDKTFTAAEAVSEWPLVPLCQISAGMLGIKAVEVEQKLQRALDLCKMSNVMLLIGETDIFLGARNMSDLARNELLSSTAPSRRTG